MSNIELVKELRALTSAGMADCKAALEEANWDLQKAVDVIKVKGKNISDGRSGKVAAEGRVSLIVMDNELAVMVENNCQTDFVANSKEFIDFSNGVLLALRGAAIMDMPFTVDMVEEQRKEVVAKTKENVVVRRWWIEQAQDPTVRVFAYLHSNDKIGVLLTMQAPSEIAADSTEFQSLGSDLAMQVCAMSPLAISDDRLSNEDRLRQQAIFETQLREDVKPKPTAMWPKIIEGKFRKWASEVCLLEQESVLVPKNTVQQVINGVGAKLGGDIKVINFVRCQVGEGVEKKQDDLAEEVAKLM